MFKDLISFLIIPLTVIGLTPLLGSYMAHLFLDPKVGRLEKICYLFGGVDPSQEMTSREYLKNILGFNLVGALFLFLLLFLQSMHPLNPENFPALSWDLAFNTAVSFTTNTNWQSYAGETTLSYFSQMVGLTVQNFLSAATGMAALLVLIRGFMRRSMSTIGNCWVDLTRTLLYLLFPLALILAILLVSQGAIQNFLPYQEVTTLENDQQKIPMGPVASQVAIKQLGSNGGGFFNANSAHPFENPTPFTNYLETIAILLIPAASVYMYGKLIGNKPHAFLIYTIMGFFFLLGVSLALLSEYGYNPFLGASAILEGKETRFGIMNSMFWSNSTTATSNGSVNAMLSSLSPLGGGLALFNIMLGEIIFGGVGVGLSGFIMFILLTVFLSGLMVGRTPEYLGKKIEKREMQWVVLAVLMPGSLILIGAGLSAITPYALSSLAHDGPHGLTEVLYAFASAAGNNGSAFAGIEANNPYFNLLLGAVMLAARLAILVPSVAVAGLIASKNVSPPSQGTFSTNTYLFAILLMAVILIIGALTFFPALALGPIVEQLLMQQGRGF